VVLVGLALGRGGDRGRQKWLLIVPFWERL